MLIWKLEDPSGKIILVTNLDEWCKINAALFGKTPEQWRIINAGIRALKRSKEGLLHRNCASYYGWKLLSWKWQDSMGKSRRVAPNGYISMSEAARQKRISIKKISSLRDKGAIEGILHIGPYWYVPLEWVRRGN